MKPNDLKLYLMILLTVPLLRANPVAADQDVVFDSGERQVTLVELYTSEGCSSCPPADAWIGQFMGDRKLWHEIVPLAFHVDYWNYLGWKDEYARADFSRRQRQHQVESNINSVYTPGFVINGMEWRGYFGRQSLPIQSTQNPGNLKLIISGDSVTLSHKRKSQSPLIANLVFLRSEIESEVQSGENAGKTLTHNFVALDHQSLEQQGDIWQFNVTPSIEATAIAAWLSSSDSQAPIQAVGGWLPNDQ